MSDGLDSCPRCGNLIEVRTKRHLHFNDCGQTACPTQAQLDKQQAEMEWREKLLDDGKSQRKKRGGRMRRR